MSYENLVLKTYELSLEPDKLGDFLEAWDKTKQLSPSELDGLDAHLTRAAEVLDRLAAKDHSQPVTAIFEPGLEAFVNYLGEFIYKSKEWEFEHPDCATFFDAVPEWHHEEIKHALGSVKTAKTGASKLIVCRSESGQARSQILVQVAKSSEVELANTFYIRWLKTAWSNRLNDYFSENHDLTTAELTVLKHIVQGFSFQEIKTMLGKSQETIKTQSKAIYSKLGLSNREDAVRFVLHIHFLLPSSMQAAAEHLEKLGSEVLKIDGAKLGVVRKGQLSGKPFIFLHGMVSGYEMGAKFEERLRRENLCAICIERPGYGRSDDPKNPDRIFDEWLEKFPAILDALGLKQVCLVSHASGAAYVAATMARYPNLVSRGLGISAGIPNLSGQGNENHPLLYRFLHWCVNRSRGALGFFFKVHTHYLSNSDKLKKHAFDNYGSCKPDYDMLQKDENMQCVLSGYELFQRPKLIGLIGDLGSIWSGSLLWADVLTAADSTSHFHHVWGSEDPMVNFDECREYCDSYPFVSWSQLQGGGHLTQFSHPEELVARINRMVLNDPNWTVND